MCRLAGHSVVATPPMTELSPFETSEPDTRSEPPVSISLPSRPHRLFSGRGEVGGRSRRVDCDLTADGYHLTVEDAGELWVNADGSRLEGPDDADPEARVSALLGPGLILSLALRSVFCLHASAILRPPSGSQPKALAFLGPSGAGKSTLARELAAVSGASATRIADDVLPVAGISVRPRFPQLKLDGTHQPTGPEIPEDVPLETVYVLGEGDDVQIEPLSTREAAQALLAQTVASRLFAPELLARHLLFAAELAEAVPCARLVYPRRTEALARVAQVLEIPETAA